MKNIKINNKLTSMLYETLDELKGHHPLLDVRQIQFDQEGCVGIVVLREEKCNQWQCVFEGDNYEVLESYGLHAELLMASSTVKAPVLANKVPFSKILNMRNRYIDISKDISDNKKYLSKAIDRKVEIERDIKEFQDVGEKLGETKSELLKYFESIGIELDESIMEKIEEVPRSRRIRKQVFKKTESGYEED